jgi:hypothetical protein
MRSGSGGEGDEPQRREAMAALTTRYWAAVYAYLRTQRQMSREDAAELTQAFFAHVVIGRRLFERADESRGRLRSLLLTALRRFIIDEYRHEVIHGAEALIPQDALDREDARFGPEAAAGSDGELCHAPDENFERRWAMGLLEESLRRCERHFRQTGRAAHWELFEWRVLRPAVTRNQAAPLAELAPRLGFRSPALAAAAVQVVKRRAAAFLRESVAETVEGDSEIEAELAEVRRRLSSGVRA